MNSLPELSVVMSVYNGQDHLEESIASILNQTYYNYEFIIVNDGSEDRTGSILEDYAKKDQRIILLHQKNLGLASALNRAVDKANGRYIARQDADDISFPERFEIQMAFLKNHPWVVLCGTWFKEINENKGFIIRKYPKDDSVLRKYLKYVNYFCHPSVIFKKEAFVRSGGYDESFLIGQDFELWIRMSEHGKLANIPEVLLEKRIGFSSTVSWRSRHKKKDFVKRLLKKHFKGVQEVDLILFSQHYLPLILYGYIPTPLLKIFRWLRYR